MTALAIAMVVAVVRTTATPTAADWTAALVFGSFAALATILKYRSYGSRMVANMAFLPLMSACVIAPNGASIAVVVAVELIGAVAHHMQDRPEYFLGQLFGIRQFENMRRDIIAAGSGPCEMHASLLFHSRDMGFKPLLGLGIDHRSDMSSQVARIADSEFARRA